MEFNTSDIYPYRWEEELMFLFLLALFANNSEGGEAR